MHRARPSKASTRACAGVAAQRRVGEGDRRVGAVLPSEQVEDRSTEQGGVAEAGRKRGLPALAEAAGDRRARKCRLAREVLGCAGDQPRPPRVSQQPGRLQRRREGCGCWWRGRAACTASPDRASPSRGIRERPTPGARAGAARGRGSRRASTTRRGTGGRPARSRRDQGEGRLGEVEGRRSELWRTTAISSSRLAREDAGELLAGALEQLEHGRRVVVVGLLVTGREVRRGRLDPGHGPSRAGRGRGATPCKPAATSAARRCARPQSGRRSQATAFEKGAHKPRATRQQAV